MLSTPKIASFRDRLTNQLGRARRLVSVSGNLDPFGTFSSPGTLLVVTEQLSRIDAAFGQRKGPLVGMEEQLDALTLLLDELDEAIRYRRLKVLRYTRQFPVDESRAAELAAAAVEQDRGQDFYNGLLDRFAGEEEPTFRNLLHGLALAISAVGNGERSASVLRDVIQELAAHVASIHQRWQDEEERQ